MNIKRAIKSNYVKAIEEANEDEINIIKWTERINYIIDSKDKKTDLLSMIENMDLEDRFLSFDIDQNITEIPTMYGDIVFLPNPYMTIDISFEIKGNEIAIRIQKYNPQYLIRLNEINKR